MSRAMKCVESNQHADMTRTPIAAAVPAVAFNARIAPLFASAALSDAPEESALASEAPGGRLTANFKSKPPPPTQSNTNNGDISESRADSSETSTSTSSCCCDSANSGDGSFRDLGMGLAGQKRPQKQEGDESERVQGAIVRWKKGQMLGKGGFGSVFLALNLNNGKLFAVKQIEDFDDSAVGMQDLSALENEIKTLQQCKHPNIVQYLGYERSETSISIFLEYVSGGSICGLLERFVSLEESVVRVYTRQLLLGLEYLHLNGVAHRDIKGGNVLVAHDGTIKLADFGASKRIWSSSSRSARYSGAAFGIKGTAMWMAPEVIREDQSERMWKKADMWSVGCTVVEMLTGKPPWHQFTNPVTAMYHIACGQNTPDIPGSLSAHGRGFLQACFHQDPKERPDVSTILLHPFVARAGDRTRGAALAHEYSEYLDGPLASSRSLVQSTQRGPRRAHKEKVTRRKQKGSAAAGASRAVLESKLAGPNSGVLNQKCSKEEDDCRGKEDDSLALAQYMTPRLDFSKAHLPPPPAKEDERVELHLPATYYIGPKSRDDQSSVSFAKGLGPPLMSSPSPSQSHRTSHGDDGNRGLAKPDGHFGASSSAARRRLPKITREKGGSRASKTGRGQGKKSHRQRSSSASARSSSLGSSNRSSGSSADSSSLCSSFDSGGFMTSGSSEASSDARCKTSRRPRSETRPGEAKGRAESVRIICDPFEMVKDAIDSFALQHNLSPHDELTRFADVSYKSSDSRHPLSLSSTSSSMSLSRGSDFHRSHGRQIIPPLAMDDAGSKSARASLQAMSTSPYDAKDGQHPNVGGDSQVRFGDRGERCSGSEESLEADPKDRPRVAARATDKGSASAAVHGGPDERTKKLRFAPILPMGEGGMAIHMAARGSGSRHTTPASPALSSTTGSTSRGTYRSRAPTSASGANAGLTVDPRHALQDRRTLRHGNLPEQHRTRFAASYDARRPAMSSGGGRSWNNAGPAAAVAAARESLASDAVSRSRSDWDKTPPLRQFGSTKWHK